MWKPIGLPSDRATCSSIEKPVAPVAISRNEISPRLVPRQRASQAAATVSSRSRPMPVEMGTYPAISAIRLGLSANTRSEVDPPGKEQDKLIPRPEGVENAVQIGENSLGGRMQILHDREHARKDAALAQGALKYAG